MGLLKMSEKYSPHRLEAACQKALSYTASPSYKSVKTILQQQSESDMPEPEESSESTVNPYGITRGADYYNRR